MPTFPATHHSVVAALASADVPTRERAVAEVLGVYRAPVIAVLRRRLGLDESDAEDLAHDFFAAALERDWLARYDANRGRFRTFLWRCLFAYASTAHERATRKKRGGGVDHTSLDAVPVLQDAALATAPAVDAFFDAEWRRSVLHAALQALEAECQREDRRLTWEIFAALDLRGDTPADPPTYAELATRFDVPKTQVTNYLNWARRRLRAHVVETLRALTTSDAELDAEVRALFSGHE